MIADRDNDYRKTKKWVKELRGKEKSQKRIVKESIAHDIIDLILDVTHEAFKTTTKQGSLQGIEKAKWRSWMGQFKEGVSVCPPPPNQFIATNKNIELDVPQEIELEQ